MDHLDHIRDEFFNPIRRRVLDLLEEHKIEFATESMTRLTMAIAHWEVEFDGLFRQTSDGGEPITLRRPTYHKVVLAVRIRIDTIDAGTELFHFIQAIKDHEKYSEAIEGSAWQIFNKASKILKDGFPPE
jgi:hypothetical protein